MCLSHQDATEWSNWGELMQESKKQLLGGSNLVTFTMCEGGRRGGLCARVGVGIDGSQREAAAGW